jgi:hypothetical protein
VNSLVTYIWQYIHNRLFCLFTYQEGNGLASSVQWNVFLWVKAELVISLVLSLSCSYNYSTPNTITLVFPSELETYLSSNMIGSYPNRFHPKTQVPGVSRRVAVVIGSKGVICPIINLSHESISSIQGYRLVPVKGFTLQNTSLPPLTAPRSI